MLTAEHLFAFALPHLGHKGLFLDRLDGDGSSPRLVPFGHAVYHMRNRAYAPGLGRFLQRDPNQTAMALAESAAMHARVNTPRPYWGLAWDRYPEVHLDGGQPSKRRLSDPISSAVPRE